MRTFAKPNYGKGEFCPLCKTNSDGEIVLIRIAGTEDGNIAEAAQVHTACLQERMFYYKNENVIVAEGQK